MIVGNGMIARSMISVDRDDTIFFASGVSDSKVVQDEKFERELNLIKSFSKEKKKIVYFSSVPYYISNSFYRSHKLKAEETVKKLYENFLILRLPQVVGKGGNPNNFFNFFVSSIMKKEPLTIRNELRSLIDIEDVVKLTDELLNKKFEGIFQINYIEKMKVFEIIQMIAEEINKDLVIQEIQESSLEIEENAEFVENILKEKNIKQQYYTRNLIKKYL